MADITPMQRQELRNQGYDDNEINKALGEVEKEELEAKTGVPRSSTTGSAFNSRPTADIVMMQLELNDILERAEHMLKGDIVTIKDGKQKWEDNPFPEDNCLDAKGVQILMKILSMYLIRLTILSDYDKTEIPFKVLDFGKRLNDLIFMKYEEMGINTEDKRKEYAVIVGCLVDMVHSAFNRAKDGGERRSLREMINVSQSSQMMQQPNQMMMQPKIRGMLNPMRYIAGKYVS